MFIAAKVYICHSPCIPENENMWCFERSLASLARICIYLSSHCFLKGLSMGMQIGVNWNQSIVIEAYLSQTLKSILRRSFERMNWNFISEFSLHLIL